MKGPPIPIPANRTLHLARVLQVARRTAIGAWANGAVHAGNLAYLALTTLFPFFIVAAAIARLVGRTEDGIRAVVAFLHMVPPNVAEVLRQPILAVLRARSGSLLWFGALVGLWTTASFIETLRAILRGAYGVTSTAPFWRYRLGSVGLTMAAVILAMLAFSLQVVLIGVEQFLYRILPLHRDMAAMVSLGRLLPALLLFGAFSMLFYALTPRNQGFGKAPRWPGVTLVTLWWLGVTAALPPVLGRLTRYDLTYGSLAGVMITLIFFYLIGLGVVIGAELNAALAQPPEKALEGPPDPDRQEQQAS